MRPVIPCLFFLAVLTATGTVQAEPFVDPHWTGLHCAECHEKNPPALRSGGDINAMCIRCHGPGSEARFEVHQVNIQVPEKMKARIPAGWPLAENKITCLTCHEIQTQMYENLLGKIFNINFLRQKPPAVASLCYSCHDSSRFEQPNPHKLMISRQGVLNDQACLQCHQRVPDPDFAAGVKDAALKGFDHPHQEFDNGLGGIELAAPFTFGSGEPAEEILINPAEDVL